MQPQYAMRTCVACALSFQIPQKNVRRGEGKYCSRQCAGRAKILSFEVILRLKVDRSAGLDACWPWLGRRDSDGYGLCWSSNRRYRSHRVAWAAARGVSVDTAPLIRHLCDGGGNPWCCNPRHLASGTVADNTDDKVRAGRQSRGESSGMSKLTADDVREIRRRGANGESLRALGRAFGVSGSTIRRALRAITWRHVQ